MVAGRDWSEIKSGLTSVTQDDWAEIDFQVKLVGEILDARKDKGMTQSELDKIFGVNQTASVGKVANG